MMRDTHKVITSLQIGYRVKKKHTAYILNIIFFLNKANATAWG